MNKYSIINNQWKWNYTDYPSKKLLEISDLETLYNRGKYLIEVIDKLSFLTYNDIDNLPTDSRYVVPYGPSLGKTTAIRQFLLHGVGNYYLYATKLVEDVDKFYYDLLASYYYNYHELPSSSMINKYTSNHRLSIEECQNTSILITTHERLYTDPPSILYIIDKSVSDLVGGLTNTRSAIFIDEYIKSFITKSVKLIDYKPILDNIKLLVDNITATNDPKTRSVARSRLLYHLINPNYKYIKLNPILRSIDSNTSDLLNLYNTKNKSFKFKYNKNDKKSIYRSVFFLNLLCDKYDNCTDTNITDISYKYNLPDFINNLYIFDGTGDIMMRSSKKFKILDIDNKYSRILTLNNPPSIIQNSSFSRVITSLSTIDKLESIIESSFIKSIIKILDSTPGNLLIYTWKSIKISPELSKVIISTDDNIINMKLDSIITDLPKYIKSKLSSEYLSRVRIITYQSGKERVTSEYTDCSSIYILGKFMIPNSTISDFNEVTESSSTSSDFTKSLIIQAIYRTSARNNKPIDIFFSDDYNSSFVYNILNEFVKLSILNNSDNYYIDKFCNELSYNTRNKKYYDFIVNNIDKIYNSTEIATPDNEIGYKFKLGLSKYLKNYNNVSMIDSTHHKGKSTRSSVIISIDK